jgi:hypothetical protein
VKITDRHGDLGRVGALAPAPAQQAALPQPTRATTPAAARSGHRPAAARGTLGEHRGGNATVRQVKAQRAGSSPAVLAPRRRPADR